MTPAEHVIKKCGGPKRVAVVLGIDVSNVHRWKYDRSKGGRDGHVPADYAQRLLTWAPTAGISLHPNDFFLSPEKTSEASDAA